MIRIAIFDDHTEQREALAMLIEVQENMICVGTYGNCSNIVKHLQDAPADVVLMDIDMPEINGIEGVQLIHSHFPRTLVIMQTVFDDDDKIFRSIQSGANGYILKKAAPEKVIDAIHEVLNGGAPMTASIAKRVLQLFRSGPIKNIAGKHEEMASLTARELEILEQLVKGFSHKMVSSNLHISVHTVNNHVKNIYSKLQVNSVSQAVSIALKNGIT